VTALALALLIGAALVMLGAGGSIVTMPILVYAAGLDAHRAVGTSLFVVGLVALSGTLVKWRTAEPRTAFAFGLAGMLGAVPGAWLNHHVPALAVLLGFGATALIAATQMARTRGLTPAPARHRCMPAVILAGTAVGFSTGLFGVGGGFLIVPALTLLLGLDMECAVATSLLVITMNCGAGLVAHAGYGAVEWRLGINFTAVALFGAMIALPLARRVDSSTLRRIFAVVLAAVGVGMLAQALTMTMMWA
jgi:uncharacterized membrane protein YfcA